MEQGRTERGIIERCIRERQPLPETIANAPELGPGLDFFYMAFLDLHSCRDLGTVEGPITWLTIQRYSEVYNVTGEQREDLFYHVQQLDQAYLEWSREKSKKDLAAKKPPPSPKPRR